MALVAGYYLLIANILLALFQLALGLGAPMGEYAFGGRHKGKLPARFRWASFLTFVVLSAVAAEYARILELIPSQIDPHLRAYQLWAFTAFYAIILLANGSSKSMKEKKLILPVTASMLIANIVILVFYRLG